MAKVYVIDDSMSVCFAIERMLTAVGMEVISEQSGEAALDNLESIAPDLVLCDLVLPDVEGFQICGFIKGHPTLSSTPIIVISGIVDEQTRAQAHRIGAVGVLKKPFGAEDLLAMIEKVLGVDLSASGVASASGVVANNETPFAPAGAAPASAAAPAAPAAPAPAAPMAQTPTPAPAAPLPRLSDPRFDQLEEELAPLAGLESLRFACLLTPDGDLRGFGAHKPEADEVAHVPELLRFASAASGRVGHGKVGITTIEADDGVLVILPWHADCLLAVGLGDVAVLGKARYMLRRMAAGLPLPGWT